jgi:uncharacterized OB-fold protein
MAETRVPAIEGWFTMPPDDVAFPADGSGVPGIRLIGTRCVDSGTYFFPPERVMSRAPGFADSELVEVELSTTGTLWSYTDAQYQPPAPFVAPTDPYQPYCLAAVELAEERLVVLGQVVAGVTVEDLQVGMPMELVADALDTDGERTVVVWKWRPATTGADETNETNGAN